MYNDFNSDGSDIPSYSAYVYDATKTMIDAVVGYVTSLNPLGQPIVIPPTIDSHELTNYMISQKSVYSGYTGKKSVNKLTFKYDITCSNSI